jgi:hypothetical protein
VVGVVWSGVTVAVINLDGLNEWIKFFTGLGGLVVVALTAISFWYDIVKKRRELKKKH